IIIAVVIIIIIITLVTLFLLTPKKEIGLEEVVLTEEERNKLNLTEEERAQGLSLDDKEEKIKSEGEKELENSNNQTEEVRVLQIKKIIDREIKFPVFSADKSKLLYFDPKASEFYTSNLDGLGENVITNARFENLYDISWSPDRKKTVLTFSSDKGKTKKYHYFNLNEQKDIEYGKEYQDVSISFNGDNVAYMYRDFENKTHNLSVANHDLTSWRKIKSLDEDEINLKWFSNKYLAIYASPSANVQSELYIYDVAEGKDHFVIASKRWGLSPLFSPDGKKVIYNDNETKNSRFPVIWISNVEKGSVPVKLQLSSLVEKCTWASDNITVFCGVPENYSNFFIQPNDYYEGKFVSKDSFYKINTETKEQLKLADASQFNKDYDIYSPFVSNDGKNMYFVRKHDGKLYELVIP
ncbi:MAG: PD40 domain-containing protein, partial [Parcubacteria group bacterium]|nr:PD40 domain-containing protein [Parcubacteria group bacterium]